MKTLAKFLSRKSDKNADESGCEQAMKDSYDITSKKNIEPLVRYIQNYHCAQS